MNKYTDTVNYIEPTKLTEGKSFRVESNFMPDIIDRHYREFNHVHFENPIEPPFIQNYVINEEHLFNLNVLRMAIKAKNSDEIKLPKELYVIEDFIKTCLMNYVNTFNDLYERLVYITIRTCDNNNYYKNVGTWHVDSFQGSRIARHKPDLCYIWSNNCPTEFAIQRYDLRDFDYSKYNIHSYFRDYTEENNIFRCDENSIYMMDPYMVHRAPICDFMYKRIFIRLHTSEVEIEDSTSTINPMLPYIYPVRNDVRNTLIDYIK